MTGLFNNNFLFGFLLARDRKDQNEKLSFGLTASQFSRNNPLGLVMLKKQIDTLEEVEGERDALQEEVKRLAPKDPDDPGPSTPPPADSSVGDLRLCRQRLLDARRLVVKANKRAADINTELFDCQTKLERMKDDLDRCTAKAADRAGLIRVAFDDFRLPQVRLSDADSDDVKAAIDKGIDTYTTKVIDAVKDLRSRVFDYLK